MLGWSWQVPIVGEKIREPPAAETVEAGITSLLTQPLHMIQKTTVQGQRVYVLDSMSSSILIRHGPPGNRVVPLRLVYALQIESKHNTLL